MRRSRPRTLVELGETIIVLHRAGVLRAPDGAPVRATRAGFAGPELHIAMLRDAHRTEHFCRAVRALVQPNDAVLDIGTGTGILAATAALAGARHVYAVESTAIADVAARVFAQNGIAERVTLMRGRSTTIAIPEQSDLLIAELIGHEPLHEDILEVVLDARRRLIATAARIVPATLEIVGIPVDVGREIYGRHVFDHDIARACRRDYGVDLSPLSDYRAPPSQAWLLEPADLIDAQLAPATSMTTIDLAPFEEPSVHASMTFVVPRPVEHLGLAVSFRAALAPGISLSPALPDIDPTTSWLFPVFVAPEAFRAAAGACVTIDYRYRRHRTEISFRTESVG